MKGQIETKILNTENGVVRLCNDTYTCSYSIGIMTDQDFEWKFISEELYNLLIKELSEQEGKRF